MVKRKKLEEDLTPDAGAVGDSPEGNEALPQAKKNKVQAMSQKKLERLNEDQKNRGVVYISRIPPFMKADQIRRALGEYGDIDRIYLTPECKCPPASERRRFQCTWQPA
jgi:ESF2/ABP1 family protein